MTNAITTTAEHIVRNSIIINVSTMIEEISSNMELFTRYEDEICSLSSRIDYQECAYQELSAEEYNEAAAMINVDWAMVCEANALDADCYIEEALEFWAIDEWLADKLEDAGELIARDVMGFTVWGRTCSGQAISMDGAIQTIARNLNNATKAA